MKRIRRVVGSKTKFRNDVTVLGIDPDVNHCGVAVLMDGEMVEAQCVTPGAGYSDRREGMARGLAEELDYIIGEFHPSIIVIEWQNIRPSDPRPNDILELATVAGMALGACVSAAPDMEILRPLPVQWKGSVKKSIHQKRILSLFDGMDLDAFDGISASNKNHAVDALGLAVWGAQ